MIWDGRGSDTTISLLCPVTRQYQRVVADLEVKKLQRALKLLDRFEAGAFPAPLDAETLVVEIFEACGHTVLQKGFVGAQAGVDCFVRTNVDGRPQTIGVEVKAGKQPAEVSSVDKAFKLKASGHFDRAMILSRSGFSTSALRLADTIGLGQIDLFSPVDLRNWLSKQAQPEKVDTAYERIVRGAMQELARLIAEHPEALAAIEWRELEKVLRETFEGIGFRTKLTRPGKDGGFDLELSTTEGGLRRIYLVEVKHWTDQRPGSSHLKKLISVTASKQAAGALLLSTSGFTRTIYSGIAEYSAPVRLADGDKVVSLCKTYYRLKSALWLENVNLQETLLSGTRAIGE
jgi:Restriction endonuclease